MVDDDDDAGIVDRREQVFLLLILLPDEARFGEQADIGVVVGLRGLQIAENGGVVLRTRKIQRPGGERRQDVREAGPLVQKDVGRPEQAITVAPAAYETVTRGRPCLRRTRRFPSMRPAGSRRP